MKRLPIPSKTDTELRNTLYSVMDGAIGAHSDLTSAPTSANGILKSGERGIFNGVLYENVNGVVYSYTTTQH